MKDDRGVYYYPFPQNKNVRMYVREEDGTIFFRLWNLNDPGLWEKHGWIPYEAIMQASKMYKKANDFDPEQAYNAEIAKAVLEEGSSDQ